MDERCVDADVFVRFSPSREGLSGAWFGLRGGATRLEDGRTRPGVGFDANESWLLSPCFYVNAGIGLTRPLGRRRDSWFDLQHIPTVRLHVGLAFRGQTARW